MATPQREYNKQRERRFQTLPPDPVCRVCGEADLTKLVKDRKKPLGVIGYCKSCARTYNKKRSEKHWHVVHSIRAKGCIICGETDRETLDFHHTGDKEFHPTQYISTSTEKFFKELSKCVCVCANDHRRLHAGTRTLDLVRLWSLSDLYGLLEEYQNGDT